MSDSIIDLLATGIPAGLVGTNIDPDAYGEHSHLATVTAFLTGIKIDTKNDGCELTFTVPREHFYVAMPLKDVKKSQLILMVHANTAMTRERFGASAALKPTAAQNQRAEITATIAARHTERRFKRAMKGWVGADGPGDGTDRPE